LALIELMGKFNSKMQKFYNFNIKKILIKIPSKIGRSKCTRQSARGVFAMLVPPAGCEKKNHKYNLKTKMID
jgi:hypothetical protein